MSLQRQTISSRVAVATPAPGPRVYSQPVRYEYSCLPPGHVDRRAFTLFVQERSDGRWCVTDAAGYVTLSDTGQWDYEPPIGQPPAVALPVHRDRAWLDHHRFDLPTAQALAAAHAPLVQVNGRTAADRIG